MTQSVVDPQAGRAPEPSRQQSAVSWLAKHALRLFGIVYMTVPAAFAIVMLKYALPEYGIEGNPAYGLVVPVLAAAALCSISAILLLITRKRWAVVACAASVILVPMVYLFLLHRLLGRVPGDVCSVLVVLLPLVLLAAIPETLKGVSVAEPPPSPLVGKAHFKVGTLRYTGFGMFMVFFWLLWGDFICSLLDGNVPGILPLKLNDLGAGDTVNIFLNKTLAYSIAFLFAPAVSFRSDRHRGPRGRRIPFLAWSTPFVGAFLILIGFYDGLTNLFMGTAQQAHFLGMTFGRGTVTLVVFATLFVAFDFSNIFVGTVYWYLFNDVVPEKYLSQFLSLFRIVGTAAGMLYSGLIFPHALEHFRIIFAVAGVFYIIGFLAMCFMVREGNYPPPPPMIDHRQGQAGPMERAFSSLGLGAVGRGIDGMAVQARTYAKECFTHRFYWYFFLTSTCMFMSWQSGMFGILRNRNSLGLTLQELGTLSVYTGFVSLLLQYPAGWVSDKIHPIRVYMFTTLICVLQNVAQCTFIFHDFGTAGNLTFLYILSFTVMPFGALQGAAELPMYMRLLPKERYGQFCSANAMIRSFAMIFGSALAGGFMDMLHSLGDWRYRYYPVWVVVFQIPACIFLILMYREWKRRGGEQGYTPPEA